MSTAQVKNKSASIRDKLYNLSKNSGIDLNNLIILYMQERILYRLCQSSYYDKFVLKGGLLLFAHHGFYGRPTKDIDLLGMNISNDIDYIGKVFKEILSQDYRDGLCVYRNIRTAIPETSGHETGGIRTLCRLT